MKNLSVKKRITDTLPIYFLVFVILFIITAITHTVSVFSPSFADFINVKIASGVRFILAKLTGIFNFSLAETLVMFLPLLLGICIFFMIKSARKNDRNAQKSLLFILLSVLITIYILFVFTLGTGYHAPSLDKKLSLDRSPITATELKKTADILNDGINSVINEVNFDESSASVMPYSTEELNLKLNKAYARIGKEYDFIQQFSSKVKPILLSKPMTYTYITGVYSFFSGEANINTNYPDYLIPFTMAHEMAHQRGIAREDEANFIAFLVCISSDDCYIRYSGYTQVLEYTMTALHDASSSLYSSFVKTLDDRYKGEIKALDSFFDHYDESIISDVSSGINDAYQQMQGQSAGVKSYGLVVDLAVSYYKQEKSPDD